MKKKSWIVENTGKTDRYWLDRIGMLIGKHAWKEPGQVHSECDVLAWIDDLCKEVCKRSKSEALGVKYDGNMRMASVLSYVLMKWFVRLVRAKSYDPRRPVKIRRRMMHKLEEFCIEVFRFMTDESEDPKHFPKQKWDVPFASGAKNGKYV